MPNATILDMTGKKVGDMSLSDAIFGIEPNAAVMHAAVVNYLANQRQGTQSTLTRSEVSDGGRKPWRQKGTSRKTGFHPCYTVDPRRNRSRTEAQRLLLYTQQEG